VLFHGAVPASGRPLPVTLAELARWETRRVRRSVSEAESLLRERLERLRGTPGQAAAASGVPAVVVHVGAPPEGDSPRADAGPQPLASLVWEAGGDAAPPRGSAARGRAW
jgi:hypothetical protein